MDNKITMFDYNMDWLLKDGNCDPRPIPGTVTREEIMAFYGSLGVDGVEIREEYWGDCTVDYLKNLAADAGLPIVSYIFHVDLAMPSATERQAAVHRARSFIDRTADLGAGIAMIFPGASKERYSADQLRQWVIDGLGACVDHAQARGVTMAFENIDYPPWRPIHGTAEQCVEICEGVGSPALRLICDPCAALFVNQDPVELFRTMAPYVVHIHLKNSRPAYPGERVLRKRDAIDGRTLTGTVLDGGLVPIPALLDELKSLDYHGCLLIEYQGEIDPRIALPYNVEYLRRQMQGR